MSDDLIRRSDAIKAIHNYWKKRLDTLPTADIQQTDKILEHNKTLCNFINAIPSADRPQDDEFKNFDRESLILLIEAQKERIGELLADRPQGEWIEQEDCWQCSECGDEYVLEVGVKPIDARMHYCPNCGAHMKGANDE